MKIDSSSRKPKLTEQDAGQVRSTQAPGQFYGYSIQTTRMVARLLQCKPGQAVSLEVLDDVGVTGEMGSLAEQVKSGLAHNPIADRSVDLWKTLYNWLSAMRSGAFANEVWCVLYVAQPYKGKVIERINGVKRPEDASGVIAALRDEFWGAAPRRRKKASLPKSLAKYVNGVLEAGDDALARLFASIELETGSGSPVTDLNGLLIGKAIGSAAAEPILNALLGWTKKRVEILIESGKPAIITFEEFSKQLISAARKYDRSEQLAQTPVEISARDVEEELRSRHYVTQLRWVDCVETELVSAVNAYLRSSVDRTTWSERGDVLEGSFQEFSDQLERHWLHRRRLAEIELRDRTEAEIGQVVLNHCLMATVHLEGREVPSYFIPGSYHALADTFVVGWHPRFSELQRATPPLAKLVACGDSQGKS